MENLQGSALILRKVGIITLIGVAAIFLSGPILALLGALLPFLIVGSLVYLVIQAFVLGPRAVGRTIRAGVRLVAVVPVWIGRNAWAGVRFVGRTIRGFLSLVAGIVFPIVGGALIGGVLGVVGGVKYGDADFRVPAAALLGACIALVAKAFWPKSDKVLTVKPVPDQPQRVHQCAPAAAAKRFDLAAGTKKVAGLCARDLGPWPHGNRGVAKVVLVSESRD